MASAWSAFAQTHTSDSIAGSRVLDGVTVRGNAGASRVSATAPLHLVDAEAMRRFGIADMADALRRLPGVVLRDYGGAGGMKTVSVRGFGARHTGVSYDGVGSMFDEGETIGCIIATKDANAADGTAYYYVEHNGKVLFALPEPYVPAE